MIPLRRCLAWTGVLALVAGLATPSFGQEPAKRLKISCIVTPAPKIDGLLDDACWNGLEPVSGFFQFDPVNGAKASEETFVWCAFDHNPKAVQKNSVETIWKSGAVMREDGWSAEMAIPFKSLRFSSKKLEVWGVNFERDITRLNETVCWTA